MATVTLLQAMTFTNTSAALPRMTIHDQPTFAYRGLMIDVARLPHSIASLQQLVELCRLYKIRYFHLHLTDDQSFMFPSTAYPQIASKNLNGPAYTLDQLKGLVQFADQRGITIVPELEAPGHCQAMQQAMPETFGQIGPDAKPVKIDCLNFMNPQAYPALDTLVREMCDVFPSSPYFHIGGDEAALDLLAHRPETAQYLKDHHLDSVQDLYAQYIVKMNEIVKKHGKQAIVWEGFHGDGTTHVKIPRDVIVMEFEVKYNLPQNLIDQGYTVINASWVPLYVVHSKHHTPEHIFGWNAYQFGPFSFGGWDKVEWHNVNPTPLVAGATICAGTRKEEVELPSLRARVPAMAQKVWNPESAGNYADFAHRFAQTDALLDKLLATRN